MSSVTWDILEQTRLQRDAAGDHPVRVAIVTGLSAVNAYERQTEAADALGLSINDPHPEIATARLQRIDVEMVSHDTARCTLTYDHRDAADEASGGEEDSDIEVGASLVGEEVNTDINGNVMTVSYADHPDQSGLVSRLRPEVTMNYTRRESSSPGAKARSYVGTVNDGGWKFDPGSAARTWLCTGIVGRSADGGDSWQVTYSFQYNPDGWGARVIWMDPDTGRPPSDLVDGTGIKTYQIYEPKAFNGLGL